MKYSRGDSLLGTPAEEGGGGKVKMLDAGAYDGLDCSLMAHPGNSAYAAWGRTLASWRANVTWTGGMYLGYRLTLLFSSTDPNSGFACRRSPLGGS